MPPHLKPYWGPYAITKAALDALARTYAAETMNISRVKVMAANPGPLRTRMRAAAMPGEDPMSLADAGGARAENSRTLRA